jgi:hypothetical protein
MVRFRATKPMAAVPQALFSSWGHCGGPPPTPLPRFHQKIESRRTWLRRRNAQLPSWGHCRGAQVPIGRSFECALILKWSFFRSFASLCCPLLSVASSVFLPKLKLVALYILYHFFGLLYKRIMSPPYIGQAFCGFPLKKTCWIWNQVKIKFCKV